MHARLCSSIGLLFCHSRSPLLLCLLSRVFVVVGVVVVVLVFI